jgi:ribosomal protein L12E/L44/L45/RPP1/RPP2
VSAYDAAVTSLYQAPFAEFVAERKRLSAELKAAGDKDGARLGKLSRPPVSAWAVNQLWWRERVAFEALVEAARHVKVGDREAGKAHREALSTLRGHAARLLQEAGNAATETTLRRVATTLSAIAAQGGFEPDAPGALSADRDPPGFESLGFVEAPGAVVVSAPKADDAAERRAEAERKRAEDEERKRRLAERERLSGLLRDAKQLQTSQLHELEQLAQQVQTAEQGLKETQALLERLENELASL